MAMESETMQAQLNTKIAEEHGTHSQALQATGLKQAMTCTTQRATSELGRRVP